MKSKRGTPAVAKVNQTLAVNNIRAKIDTINAVLNFPSPSVELFARLPPSSRQFSKWALTKGALVSKADGGPIPFTDFQSNGPQTVGNNQLNGLVDEAIAAINEAAQNRRLPGERVANLRARLALSEKLRGAAERALAESISRCEDLLEERVRERAKYQSLLTKSNEELTELNFELNTEQKRAGELIHSLSKISRVGVRR